MSFSAGSTLLLLTVQVRRIRLQMLFLSLPIQQGRPKTPTSMVGMMTWLDGRKLKNRNGTLCVITLKQRSPKPFRMSKPCLTSYGWPQWLHYKR